MTPFSVLAVCTANICRSPMIEILLRHQLDDQRFLLSSAGVQGWRDAPVDGMVVLELARLGARADGFASRALTDEHIENADLILTATREHRAFVLDRSPDALRKTFTLREFAALVRDVDAASPEALVDDAFRRRSAAQIDIDLFDPYRQPPVVHRAVAEQIRTAVDSVATALSAAAN